MKAWKANLGEAPPHCCAKCGRSEFELVDDGLQCLYDGWMIYLTDEQIAAFRIGGLDKMKSVCHDRGNGKEAA